MRRLGAITLIGLTLWGALGTRFVQGCPFCSSVAQTFSEELSSAQVAVLARLESPPLITKEAETNPAAPLPKATFRVQQIIKGKEWVKKDQLVEVLFFGESRKDRVYLIQGQDAPNVMWSTPLALSDRACEYVLKLGELPTDATRLNFFQGHLEDEDEMLARDAFDEFAKTPYPGVVALKDKMDHEKLVKWVKDPAVPASRRRLYFTMLGVCGSAEDAPMLSALMRSSDRKDKAGLDAMIASYIQLSGEDALRDVEAMFLDAPNAEYADTYAAIYAVRVLTNDMKTLDKARAIKALRRMLARAELADLVIPDLTLWQDWEAMPQLIKLFKEADEKSSWVRVPVINYLRSCPLPEAKQQIEELAKIDPDAVRRAQSFMRIDAQGTDQVPSKSSPNQPAADSQPAGDKAEGQPAEIKQPQPLVDPVKSSSWQPDSSPAANTRFAVAELSSSTSDGSSASQPASPPEPNGVDVESTNGDTASVERIGSQPTSSLAKASATVSRWQPNRWALWGVPMVAGVLLLYTLRMVLGVPWGRIDG